MQKKGGKKCIWLGRVTLRANFRWKLVQLGLDEHYKKLHDFKRSASAGLGNVGVAGRPESAAGIDANSAGAGNGNSGQEFLSVAVHYPWARALSQNKVPYYIK